MKKAEDRVVEQLKSGNPVPFADHVAKELETANRACHCHSELVFIGRAQGEAATLQKIYDDFTRAGLYRP